MPISPAGTIRVDEIMSLLQIDVSELTGAVRRCRCNGSNKIKWVRKKMSREMLVNVAEGEECRIAVVEKGPA